MINPFHRDELLDDFGSRRVVRVTSLNQSSKISYPLVFCFQQLDRNIGTSDFGRLITEIQLFSILVVVFLECPPEESFGALLRWPYHQAERVYSPDFSLLPQ